MADPMYAASDWLSALERIRQQGMAQPESTQLRAGGMPEWWWQEQRYRQSQTPGLIPRPQDVEAIPLGDVADPVSQLAFLLSPHLLAGMKALGTQVAQPGYSRSFQGGRGFLGERGNLGPPPVGPHGEPLPESVVRGPGGQLQRLFHGTGNAYPDFEVAKFGTGEGGDLYGPGIYMTESPQIAGGYAGKPLERTPELIVSSKEARRFLENIPGLDPRNIPPSDSALPLRISVLEHSGAITPEQAKQLIRVELSTPNIRPVYADLKAPFEIDKPMPEDLAKLLWEMIPDKTETFKNAFSGFYQRGKWKMSGDDFYRMLEGRFFDGDTNKVNAFLQEAGYDGITHIGGSGDATHRVYIAFSPNEVYPSFNVDALRQAPQAGGAR